MKSHNFGDEFMLLDSVEMSDVAKKGMSKKLLYTDQLRDNMKFVYPSKLGQKANFVYEELSVIALKRRKMYAH